MTGTIGQPEAGGGTGGGVWTGQSGFWTDGLFPVMALPVLSFTVTSAAQGVISWTSGASGYQLQYSTTLTAGGWQNYGAVIAGEGSLPWPMTGYPKAFFRLKRE